MLKLEDLTLKQKLMIINEVPTIAAMVLAIRRNNSLPLLVLAHVLLVLYWLPIGWFMWMLSKGYSS